MSRLPFLLLAGALATAGCASGPGVTSPSSQAAETIAIAVGPCFGFCPVYEVRVASDGTVAFDGQRHTAVLGERSRAAGRTAYASLAADLAPFRPADGAEERVACEAAISDTSTYTITWTDAGGRRTVATHRSGCTGGPGRDLDAVLRGLPGRLGIEAWSKQITRPGASRG